MKVCLPHRSVFLQHHQVCVSIPSPSLLAMEVLFGSILNSSTAAKEPSCQLCNKFYDVNFPVDRSQSERELLFLKPEFALRG